MEIKIKKSVSACCFICQSKNSFDIHLVPNRLGNVGFQQYNLCKDCIPYLKVEMVRAINEFMEKE